MPELLSVHGRCPRCSQVLNVPAGQLQNVFRCARCQYRAAAATLVEEARSSPPRLASNPGMALGAFDEDSDDLRTRVLLPGGPDIESELPLDAIWVPDGSTTSRPPPAPALQRFDAGGEGEDQQTRLHVSGSLDLAPQQRPSPQPTAAAQPRRSAQLAGRARDATLLGVPLPSVAQQPGALPLAAAAPRPAATPAAAPDLTRFDRAGGDAEDQQTRLHLPDSFDSGARAPRPLLRDQT